MATTVSYEDWLPMPEVQDATEEVIDGEIRISPPAKWTHAWTVEMISRSLHEQLDISGYLVLTGRMGLVIRTNPLTVRGPDLAIFEKRTIVEREGFVHSAPQLVAEVLAPGEDLSRRLADYAALGVPEVWVVSPEARTVEILYLDNGFLRTSHILASGVLTPKLFPQVSVDIAKIWPD